MKKGIVEAHTQKDIETLSYDILKASKSWGQFPTPVDSIVRYSELVVSNSIDVSKIHQGYITKTSDALLSALAKVRGIFDRREKIIYLDLSQIEQKKNFVKLHEVGHGVLPWQNSTNSFLDDDNTLNIETREQFEAEANLFASNTLFQLDLFEREMNKLEFGLKSAMALAKKFGASNHAAIRRFVERSKNRCALLVLKELCVTGVTISCKVRDYFQSDKFTRSFGHMVWDEALGLNCQFVQDYYAGKKLQIQNEVTIIHNSKNLNFHYDFFNNTYNAFILIYPQGEKSRGRTKISLID